MHPLLTPVKDQPESPLTPNSASELRVPGTIPFSPGFGTTGAPPIRPSASFLSHSNSFEFSPSSVASSPGMEHIPRMTPLPSPIVRGGSPGPWHRMRSRSASRPTSRSSLSVFNSGDSVFVTTAGETVSQAVNAQSQRKIYQGLASAVPQNSTVHTSGEFSLEVPGANTKSRHPAGVPKAESETMGLGISDAVVGIKREECLAKNARHRATSIESISESSPSAAGGRSSLSSSSSVSSTDTAPTAVSDDKEIRTFKKTRLAEFEAYSVPGNELKRWKAIRLLGQGTFSKVMLATSEENPQYHMDQAPSDDDRAEEDKDRGLDPRFLVAVKIVENSAAGGASRDRVESSLKRELDILKTVDHPSLVQLKAFSIQPSRALLILPYCPGGDLFDLASEHRELLTPPLIRRVFAELIGAIRYLHKNGIVHRDVKLENVLMNLTPSQISNLSNHPFNHPHPLITLTDLGLSKRVDFVNDPILTTRCGSEDYASPELLMGQPYDGRQTDAWALGVLLYALLEGRLPFDPLPGAGNKMRSRTAHRIARCEWKWLNLNEEEATYDVELQGGKEIVNGLLKRANKRVGLDKVEEDTWVKEAIQVELKRIDENVNA
ncbi:kinase-like protein [Terfezia boudieri ATCC MYA-4762]|uniref:Kinase-like protein n=1 Tax=Terfezia boudieri ATCC MYA-4762 TaxID=1051890 RepID=A0A3N4LNM0_9PEZI|nr:kinase-like protein [Terfezia boudieri ATCC MYA-4762]